MEPPTEFDMKRDAEKDLEYIPSNSIVRYILKIWIRRAVHSESKVKELEARVKELEEWQEQAMPYGRYED
jgi:hypothetical protein